MKRCILVSVLCFLFVLALPAVTDVRWRSPAAREAEVLPEPTPGASVRVLTQGGTVEMPLEEYLEGVLAGEMPAEFRIEALKAQAVAARTYTLYMAANPKPAHPEADVCTESGCCQAWLSREELEARWGEDFQKYDEKIRQAVRETAGVYLTYGGEPILACFHASSPGRTESSGALWGRALPYLVSVETPETARDVPNFVTLREVSDAELRGAVSTAAPMADFSGPPEDWVGERVLDVSGRVAAIRIGGTPIPGDRIRELFSLRSCCFTLEWTGERFLFTVEGGGHGAGLSQYGANVLAGEGLPWQEILFHYYPGAQLASL